MKTLLWVLTITTGIMLSASVVQAAGYKKDYCNNQDYYTDTGANDGSTYPHLHCASSWITYSKSGNQHYNFAGGNGPLSGTSNSACAAAQEQNALTLKGIIGQICTDYGVTCNQC
ncbi:hypothetical protein [Thalassospira sp.]|uniref:hypothetical protein n=1 Tax=Thalassospira sp. TaxID=1912094 RepID=UPI002735F8E9|nr:hypothetical protein [Thalassospira sp.]MDP2697629.1 hypothetical protein [Thalassospira sp.]